MKVEGYICKALKNDVDYAATNKLIKSNRKCTLLEKGTHHIRGWPDVYRCFTFVGIL